MRLIDNSGGIWGEVITKKKNMNLVLKQRLIPNDALMRALGEEAISSVKGGIKHKFTLANNGRGKVVFHKFNSGTYKFGIQKRISPDGELYEELKDSTIRHREWKGNFRGKLFALRETSLNIMKGLKIVFLARAAKGGKQVQIGWTGKSEELAQIQDQGDVVTSEWFDKVMTSVIPARPFRGFQSEFIEHFKKIMLDFFHQ